MEINVLKEFSIKEAFTEQTIRVTEKDTIMYTYVRKKIAFGVLADLTWSGAIFLCAYFVFNF